ncbi:universal stress protein [Haladaptatus sp. DYF46]|uniref:universal stress protein n=1 Tax=Haladaptatus sp. DYF46 TaxID=2886041 RepID=UPI001E62A8FD|nr:universal stress protein [Haladaptatus sp. DYF46]
MDGVGLVYFVGSVSEKVVRLSSVPVLTARTQPDETLKFPYENNPIPTDGRSVATYAADHLVELAVALDATVHVLSVVDDNTLGADIGSTISGKENEEAAIDAVETVVSEAETRGVATITRHIEYGTPVEEILDCIESNDIHAVGMEATERQVQIVFCSAVTLKRQCAPHRSRS